MIDKEYEEKISRQFSKNLNSFLKKNNLTQAEFAKKMQVSTATVSNWCKAIKTPRMDKVDLMCSIFHCSRSDLLEDKTISSSKQVVPSVRIPVLGRVAAGIPIEAVTDIIDWEEVTKDMCNDCELFALQIHGDSMEPRMYEGDVVIVRQQPDAESGEIVIATVNGDDATYKRLVKYADSIALVSLNPKYEPMVFSRQEVEDKPIRILGKVVELRGKF
jgi:repressor LexA